MIYNVITIGIAGPTDERGLLDRIEFDPATITGALPLFPPAETDLIYIRPDWPPIGSPDFAARLRAWHAEHNQNGAGSGPD